MSMMWAMHCLFLAGYGDWSLKHYNFVRDIVQENAEAYRVQGHSTSVDIYEPELSNSDFTDMTFEEAYEYLLKVA